MALSRLLLPLPTEPTTATSSPADIEMLRFFRENPNSTPSAMSSFKACKSSVGLTPLEVPAAGMASLDRLAQLKVAPLKCTNAPLEGSDSSSPFLSISITGREKNASRRFTLT